MGIPMYRRLMPLWPHEEGTNTSHRMSYVTRRKQKSHDNFRSEKNCMQLFVIRAIFVLSYRIRA